MPGAAATPERLQRRCTMPSSRASWSSNKMPSSWCAVGDAPPRTDYNDGFNHRAIAERARSRGIVINTVRCGSVRHRMAWLDIAVRPGGEFSSVEQAAAWSGTATPTTAG